MRLSFLDNRRWLLWLTAVRSGGGERTTITGVSPLSLLSALAKPIKSLIQYGKCTVSGTDITCNNGVLKYDSELGIYADGTPEEIKVTASGADDQTATASNLFAVGSVTDEQDIISGTITRRCEAVVSDGTTPSGRYIGTVGDGNILVCAKETGYSGAIASFTADKVEPLSGLVAEINPVQDLHGQDAPWPAGGGKNKFDIEGYVSKPDSWVINGAILSSNNNSYAQYRSQKFVSDGNPLTIRMKVTAEKDRMYCCQYYNTGTDSQISRHEFAQSETYTATFTYEAGTEFELRFFGYGASSGNISISEIQLEAGSTPTAFAPYSNICPISGWTGLQGQRTGANIWDEEWEVGGINPSTGGNWNTDTRIRSKNYIPIKPNTAYFNSYPSYGVGIDCCFYDINKTFISSGSFASVAFTSPQNAYFMRFATYGQYGATYNNDVSINYPSTDHDYHPYTGEPISVSWQDEAGTVYGGTATYNGDGTWTLVAKYAKEIIDASEINVKFRGSAVTDGVRRFNTWGFAYTGTKRYYKNTSTIEQNTWCDSYNPVFDAIRTVGCVWVSSNQLGITLVDQTIETTADAEAYVAEHPIELVLELATPIEYTITTEQLLNTLYGQNNVWHDANGDTTAYVSDDITEEYVTPQRLSTSKGDNTITVTSEVSGIQFDVTYVMEE